MAKGKIKIRAKEKNGVVTVKALMTHPMETGSRKDKKTGKMIPANFIQNVTAEVGGAKVLDSQWNSSISKNPYLSFRVKGAAKGAPVKITWTSNTGDSASGESKVK
jgi:sulfur-oxidizing protein SoxZ